MTKEEIIKQHYGCTCDKIYTSRDMIDPSCTLHEHGPEMELIMDQWADQEKRRTVIEVLDLLTKKDSQFTINYGEEKRWEGARASFTSEELYDLYLQSIT